MTLIHSTINQSREVQSATYAIGAAQAEETPTGLPYNLTTVRCS